MEVDQKKIDSVVGSFKKLNEYERDFAISTLNKEYKEKRTPNRSK